MNKLPHSPTLTIAIALLAAGLAACGGTAQRTVQTSPATAPAESSPIERAKADSARHPYTAADIRFMSGMIPHHAQAIAMARWALTHDAGPSVRILAERIINAQEDEIVTMQQWLEDRQQPVPEASPTGMKMMMGGLEHEMLMPGMLTPAQMTELNQARAAAFDRLFLTFMIQHHRGAVSMVETLFSSYGAGQDDIVFKFASDVNVDQSTEIARMERMLAALPSEQRSP